MLKITSIEERGIYTDLMREFVKNGHHLYIVSPSERREKKTQKILKSKFTTVLRVNTLNLQKTSLVEKGIGQVLFEHQILWAIKKEFSNVKFNLVLYSTPPITFSKVISYIKKRDNAYSYLLLKDIFPQNAVDLKMIKENGILHSFFLKKEKKLYEVSDKIGCMSPANMHYILKHNTSLSKERVEVNPNTIQPVCVQLSIEEKAKIRKKYNLPMSKKVFVYGGNLGKPQGIDFLLEIIKESFNKEAYFLIVGSGTEFERIQKWFSTQKPKNAILLNGLPKNEYDELLSSCDVGMIFLHKDFTIPNFPSRLLSYLEMRMPIFTATDIVTDIGKIIEANNCGYSVETGNLKKALIKINDICSSKESFLLMQKKSWDLLQSQYRVEKSYKLIIKAKEENV